MLPLLIFYDTFRQYRTQYILRCSWHRVSCGGAEDSRCLSAQSRPKSCLPDAYSCIRTCYCITSCEWPMIFLAYINFWSDELWIDFVLIPILHIWTVPFLPFGLYIFTCVVSNVDNAESCGCPQPIYPRQSCDGIIFEDLLRGRRLNAALRPASANNILPNSVSSGTLIALDRTW